MTSRRVFLWAPAAILAAQAPRKIRIAIIGTGHRAWAHINVIKAGKVDVEIVALADPTPEFRDRAATLVGSPVATYSDYRKMLDEVKDLDGVLVVTPNFLHAEVTVAALEHGLDVLCEKPMATSVADANRMIAASKSSGKILQIGQQMRHTPLYEKMAALVKEGRIGQVQFVSGNLFRGDWNPQSWRYNGTIWRFLTKTAGSSLLEDGIHELDVIHWLVGARVGRIYATGGNNLLKNRETIDHAVLAIDYENGVKVNFGFSLFAANTGPNAREMTVIGAEGNLQPMANKIAWRKRSGGQPEIIDPSDSTPAAVGSKPVGKDEDNGTYRQLVAFVKSIRAGQPGFPGGEVGKEAIQISLLAEKSLRERRIVGWNELPA